MRYSNKAIDPGDVLADNLKVSHDGYVRMLLSMFMEQPLVHFLSGLDDDSKSDTGEGGFEASISGYTEWLSTAVPKVTVGWDWRLDLTTGTPRYVCEGWPRSNVMIVDDGDGQDLGDQETVVIVTARIGWKDEVQKYVAIRYL